MTWNLNVQAGVLHPPTPTHTSHMPTTQPLSLSFNSINGSSYKPPALQNAQNTAFANNNSTRDAIASLSRLSQQQKQQRAVETHVHAGAVSQSRTLPSGYLSGGNLRMEAQAEVMRLSATIDTLNSQLSSQSERLQRTEASLVRANRSMTSERATSNARMLRMQTEVKELRAREGTIREATLAKARLETQSASTSSFEEVAKRAEERDNEMTTMSSRVAELSNERDALSKDVVQLKAQLDESITKAAAAAAASQEAAESSMLSAKEHDTNMSCIADSLGAKTKENAALIETLAQKEAEYDAIKLERDTLSQQKNAAMEATGAAPETDTSRILIDTLREKERALDSKVELLRGENDRMRVEMERVTTEAAAALLQAQQAQEAQQAKQTHLAFGCYHSTESERMDDEEMPEWKMDESDGDDDDDMSLTNARKVQTVLFDRVPAPVRARCSSSDQTVHPVELRISSKMKTMKHGVRMGLATVNPMIQYRITRASFDTGFASSSTTDASAPAPAPHVAALIGAVSKDISTACIKRRREYLTAAGMSEEEIEGELSSFA